ADDRVLDLLLPAPPPPPGPEGEAGAGVPAEQERRARALDTLREQLKDGKLDEREVEIELAAQSYPMPEWMQPPQGPEGADFNVGEWLQEMLPKRKKRRTVRVADARRILVDEELRKMVDMDDVVNEALDRVENHGIIFVDEIDKIAGERSQTGPDVSREGVQRDLLPIVEGSTVQTRYGYVRTDHILFIAAGAFHVSKPSDLIPELQGRFPIRVELDSLSLDDFVRILKEPKSALIKQYTALLETEGIHLDFTDEALHEIANLSARVNEATENIGARRLHTIMERVLDEISFVGGEAENKNITIDAAYVHAQLESIVKDQDLSRYIL
ncbi:MAG: ATP-dependent protease ATPase subunit HslU, partial [Terriglobales bacterium]